MQRVPAASGRAKREDAAQCGCCGIRGLGQMRPWGKKADINSNSWWLGTSLASPEPLWLQVAAAEASGGLCWSRS